MNSVAKYQFTNMYYVANTVLNMNNYNELSICKYFNALRMKKKTHRITNIIKAIISGFFFLADFKPKLEAFLLILCKTSVWQEIMGWKSQKSQLMSFKGQWVFQD